MLFFLPSRRAIRTVEKMLTQKFGGAVILPELVALGEGVDDTESDDDDTPDTISNTERIVILSKLLSVDKHIGNIATALPIARDLIRMTDYMENEGVDISDIKWDEIIDDKYATHFQDKAKILQILSDNKLIITNGKQTTTAKRNADIRAWISYIKSPEFKYKMVIVCGSTASVPATADLMAYVAGLPFGRIILSGKISGRESDFKLPTNPYNSEYNFLSRIGYNISDVIQIDVGPSDTIDFMNFAFGNDTSALKNTNAVSHCHLVECERESVEAAAVAEIALHAVKQKKSVLVITPDAAANQRIASELSKRDVAADFSGGRPATMHTIGRAILNLFDDWIEKNSHEFDDIYTSVGYDLFETILYMIESGDIIWTPKFNQTDEDAISIWIAIRDMSKALSNNGIVLSIADARAFIADTLSSVVTRQNISDDAHVCVLGTIESRMQSADVVILTGLNEGMFPSRGYENAWLPRAISEKIGLPSPDHKVSLMSLDFMNLSCADDVYWLRSKISGGVQTSESRFLSRVAARGGKYDTKMQDKILSNIYAHDTVDAHPLNYDAPIPPADWSDVYVTELELLIHNPYAFYVRHILRLKQIDDYWLPPDARTFGNLVHDIIEHAQPGDTPETLVAHMDNAARKIPALSGVLFRFWHKRFLEIAPFIANKLKEYPNSYAEIPGVVEIAKRTIRARADRIADGIVMDIKTGAAPTETQLMDGTMPQLPLEAYMLQSGGFKIPTTSLSRTPTMMFLQLQNNNVQKIAFDAETTAKMMHAAVQKTTDLINMFCVGRTPYENRPNSDPKYRQYDDLARTRDDF